MLTIIILVFIIGYAAIAMEHSIKIDKAASALFTGVVCWTLYFMTCSTVDTAEHQLLEHFSDISSILFFLLGAMTIVEVIDTHNGFSIITESIQTRSKNWLLIIVTAITFFLSSVLDNLTTSIVMMSLCGKLLSNKNDKLWFGGIIIIAANAGGAWSPIGDVTTTMLWIGGQITPLNIILKTFLASLMVALIPLLILLHKFKGQTIESKEKSTATHSTESRVILFTGIALLLLVPVFKTVTHMPPFMGMLLALGIIWVESSLIHSGKHADERSRYSVAKAMQRIDTSSILFFLGILLAVSALQVFGILSASAVYIVEHVKNVYIIGALLGLLSAIIDNVPLVAAAQGMFDLSTYPTNHVFWEYLALTTGTGGSIIIIGSAAGVAVMGIEKVDFFWYLKNISWIAFVGFIAGLITYIAQQTILSGI